MNWLMSAMLVLLCMMPSMGYAGNMATDLLGAVLADDTADVTRAEALKALGDSVKGSNPRGEMVELAIDLNTVQGNEYVIAWPVPSDTGEGLMMLVTISYRDTGEVAFTSFTLHIGTDEQYALCGKDISLFAEPMSKELATDMGLPEVPANALVIDDGMCGAIRTAMAQIDGVWRVGLYQN